MENLPKVIVPDEIINMKSVGDIEPVDNDKENIDVEFNYIQMNIVELIEQSKVVASSTAKLALDSDSAKAIEAYSRLIKNVSDLNKDLLVIREKRNDLIGKKAESKGTTNIQNAVFVGSTQEMYDLMVKGND